jgi:hypothetical protein
MGMVLMMGALALVAGLWLVGAGVRRREEQGIRWDE